MHYPQDSKELIDLIYSRILGYHNFLEIIMTPYNYNVCIFGNNRGDSNLYEIRFKSALCEVRYSFNMNIVTSIHVENNVKLLCKFAMSIYCTNWLYVIIELFSKLFPDLEYNHITNLSLVNLHSLLNTVHKNKIGRKEIEDIDFSVRNHEKKNIKKLIDLKKRINFPINIKGFSLNITIKNNRYGNSYYILPLFKSKCRIEHIYKFLRLSGISGDDIVNKIEQGILKEELK